MATRRFIDRGDELELLASRFERDTAELLVVYGRRRLGKSALVREAVGTPSQHTARQVGSQWGATGARFEVTSPGATV